MMIVMVVFRSKFLQDQHEIQLEIQVHGVLPELKIHAKVGHPFVEGRCVCYLCET